MRRRWAALQLQMVLALALTLALALALTLTLPWFIFPHWGTKEPARVAAYSEWLPRKIFMSTFILDSTRLSSHVRFFMVINNRSTK